MKNFFGSIFINRDKLYEAGINYPIKVEYYKITNEEEKMFRIGSAMLTLVVALTVALQVCYRTQNKERREI